MIGVFYSPKTADSIFFRNFDINIEAAFQITRNVIILGDLNEDLMNQSLHNLKDILLLNSMINVINVPTRQNALLDPILIPKDMEYSDSGTLPLPQVISDHCATFISIPFSYELQKCYERNIGLYSRANFESLNQKIENYDWSILHVGSVDDCCETLLELLLN